MEGHLIGISGSMPKATNYLQPIKDLVKEAHELIESNRYEEALPILLSRAEDKDRWAQNTLGNMYSLGLGVPIDYCMAMKYFQAAADQGCAISLLNMGVMHCLGQGTPPAHQEAMRLFKAAKDQGCANGWYRMGLLYSLGLVGGTPNYQDAMICFKAAADEHIAHAWYKLSMVFRQGLGVPPNEDEAEKCFRKAVEAGLPQNSVEEYQQAKLIEVVAHLEKQEYAAAFIELLSLTQDGNEAAQCHLVQLCLVGFITDESNLPAAISILKNAHENGESKAAFMVGKMMTKLPRPILFGRREIIDEALMWFQKAADGEKGADNYAGEAYYQMAILAHQEDLDFFSIPVYLERAHYQGHLTALNDMYVTSRRYIQAAQNNFFGDIVNHVRGLIFTENYLRIRREDSTEKSLKLKMKLQFQEQEFLETQFTLEIKQLEENSADSLSLPQQKAQFYVAQTFITKDRPDLALPLLLQLAKNNYAQAQCLLGQMHRDGMGMDEINLDQAITYFNNAFDSGYEEAGFLLIDCYLAQCSSDRHSTLSLAKEIVKKMVREHLFDDQSVDKTKVAALLAPKPTVPGVVTDWYEFNPFYLKAALKMAKIHYLENPSSGKDMQALAQEIISTADKNTQLELLEWYLTRTGSDGDKASEKELLETMMETIDVINVPDNYPKAQELFGAKKR